jgi:hypothetical protein
MRSLAELQFALDVIEADRLEDGAILAAPAGYVPGANPNNLSEAELEQRRAAALKSAEARRKTGVAEALRIRNQAVANAAVHKAQVDFFLQVAAENRKSQLRAELGDPSLTKAERQALEDELAEAYATEQLYNAERAKEQMKRQQEMRYWQKEQAQAGKRYDSAAWANAQKHIEELKKVMDDEELAGAMIKEYQGARKKYLADEERQRKQVEAAERERERQVKKFFAELERQEKKRQREAESARKKAEREAEKARKKAEREGGGDSEYAKALAAETQRIKDNYYGKGRTPLWQHEEWKNRKKAKK